MHSLVLFYVTPLLYFLWQLKSVKKLAIKLRLTLLALLPIMYIFGRILFWGSSNAYHTFRLTNVISLGKLWLVIAIAVSVVLLIFKTRARELQPLLPIGFFVSLMGISAYVLADLVGELRNVPAYLLFNTFGRSDWYSRHLTLQPLGASLIFVGFLGLFHLRREKHLSYFLGALLSISVILNVGFGFEYVVDYAKQQAVVEKLDRSGEDAGVNEYVFADRTNLLNKKIKILTGYKDDGNSPIQLTQPLLNNSSRVFKDQTKIELTHPRQDVSIRYTLDGTEPDSLTSPVFNNNLIIKSNSTIKAKAYKKGWISSGVSTFGFLRTSIKPDRIKLMFESEQYHKAMGANSLIDGQLGDFDTNNPNWLGYQDNNLEVLLEFNAIKKIQNVALNTLISPNGFDNRFPYGFSFPPTSIQVYGGTDKDNLKLIGTMNPLMPSKTSVQEIKSIYITFKPQSVSYIKIIAKPLKKLPEWHPSKDKFGILLVDEILIN